MDGRPSPISRRAALGQLALICGGASALISCADEDGAGDQSADAAAAADAGADAPGDAGIDAGPDVAADVDLDAGAADAPPADDLSADAGADAGADAAADARPGILSVAPDDPDIAAQELSSPGTRAYLAAPNRPGSFAGLILIQDDRGLTEHIKDVARRFAKSGCVALVPDLGGVGQDQLLPALDAALDVLAKQAVVGAGRTGVCGLGWGGDLALRFAAANPKLRAAVVYYATTPMPAELMKTTNAAILGQYGSADLMVNATIPDLERVMMEAGKTFEKRFYAAGHGFNDDTAATYDEAAAVASWAETIGWFDPHLQP